MTRKVVAFSGGSGLLATNLSLLLAKDHTVYLFLHKRNILLKNITSLYVNLDSIAEIEHHLLDLKVDILINCAALTNVETCEKEPNIAMHINSTIANNIAIACFQCGVKLVHISTDHLFDGTCSYYTEDSPVKPLNTYGYSKAIGEERVMSSYPASLILRTNFFGWGLPYRKSFSDFIFNNLRSFSYINLFTDVFFTPVVISELLDAMFKLIQQDCSGIYNVASSERISKYDFGRCLAQNLSLPANYILPSKLISRRDLTKRPFDMSLSNKKLLSVITCYNGDIETHLRILKRSYNDEYSINLNLK